MMNVLLKPFSNNVFLRNGVFKINNGSNIFFRFNDKLKKRGIKINTFDLKGDDRVDCAVFCDIPFFWEIDYWKYLLLNRKSCVLFAFESPVVNPLNHRKIFFPFFKYIYTWNDKLVDGKKIRKFCLPSPDIEVKTNEVPYDKKKFMTLVNSNKTTIFPLWLISPFKKDLYQKRIEIINFLENKGSDSIDLYGRGWNKQRKFSLSDKLFGFKRFTSYKEELADNSTAKVKTISKYKFNLCFENCVADGYISEKIIDCFKAYTVPVYYGAPNIEDYIPKNCFIDFRKFKNNEDIYKFLKTMNKKTYAKYIDNAKKLMETKSFRDTWFESGFEKKFIEAIS